MHSSRFIGLAVAGLIAGCTSSTAPQPEAVRLTIASASTTSTELEQLRVNATIANDTDTRLVVGNCAEPSAVIDSATATGWAELPTNQAISLIQCVAPLAIEARTSRTFDLVFSRAASTARFPRGVALRLRIVLPSGDAGPVAPLQLP